MFQSPADNMSCYPVPWRASLLEVARVSGAKSPLFQQFNVLIMSFSWLGGPTTYYYLVLSR